MVFEGKYISLISDNIDPIDNESFRVLVIMVDMGIEVYLYPVKDEL